VKVEGVERVGVEGWDGGKVEGKVEGKEEDKEEGKEEGGLDD